MYFIKKRQAEAERAAQRYNDAQKQYKYEFLYKKKKMKADWFIILYIINQQLLCSFFSECE